MKKLCLNCGITMNVKPSLYQRKKFCSRKCKGEYHSKKPDAFQHLSKKTTVICAYCGNKLLRKPSSISKSNFCNRTCRTAYLRANGKNTNQHLKKQITKICLACGEEFKVIESRKETAKYCSRSCLGKANGERGKIQYRKRVKIQCTNCSRTLERKPSIIRQWNFCDSTCMAEYYTKSGAFSGENNLAWQGGDIDYYGPNWRSQRKKARIRDNFTCQDCGLTEKEYGKELSVHHIIPFREFNGDWEEANRLTNLVCLCEHPCHRNRHKNMVDDIV
ncbi:HNH endonuclease [Bacillus sp. SD088]|uniref:HNH endonuclease n=1 Tax=Bacillus sp. SD088 TaxID=2782012 RepID=UPI001F61C587|nr:HNH endonuclease signature motif containing protein [Bacillus sp. SD088]